MHLPLTMSVSRQVSPDYTIGGYYVLTNARGVTSTCTVSGQTAGRNDMVDLGDDLAGDQLGPHAADDRSRDAVRSHGRTDRSIRGPAP
jgi:hypothetical protein